MTDQVVRNKKQRAESMPTLVSSLETGADILKELVSKHHHELAPCNILLLATNKEIKTAGVVQPGKVQKANPLIRYLSRNEFPEDEHGETSDGADVIITVATPTWNPASLRQRYAMLDHLLSRISVAEDETTGKTKLTIVGPPVQDFPEVVERHGAYNEDLVELKYVMDGAQHDDDDGNEDV